MARLFEGKETKREEAAEKKLPRADYKKGEKLEEAKMKKMADGGYCSGKRSMQDYGK